MDFSDTDKIALLKRLYEAEPTAEQLHRIDCLRTQFLSNFQCEPTFLARAPGRINIIGEHIDYCGGSVLPMAVSQDVFILVSRLKPGQENCLWLVNSNSEHSAKNISLRQNTPVEIDRKQHHWTNYFLCGYKGIVEDAGVEPLGMQCLIDGCVPVGAGMSSSSALVCAAALATVTLYQLNMTNARVAELSQKAERFVGTESGGMDQAISMLGEAGFAKRIDFNPLVATSVKLPSTVRWVVANSLAESLKAVTAFTHYNARVVECRLGSILLAKLLNVPDWAQQYPIKNLLVTTGLSTVQLLVHASSLLPFGSLTHQDIESLLEAPLLSFMTDIATAKQVLEHNPRLILRARAEHVLSEMERVFEFERICKNGGDADVIAAKLGALMCQSHQSCDSLYDCSHPDLNRLQTLCMDAGALGSRLTGAGWGGCVISMVPAAMVDVFVTTVRRLYFDQLSEAQPNVSRGADGAWTQALFVTQPAIGARCVSLH